MRRPGPTRAVQTRKKSTINYIKERGAICFKEMEIHLTFGGMSCSFSVNDIFRVNLCTKEGNSVQLCYNNVEKSFKNPLGKV